MAALYTKPKGMRYVDLAIWIDDNFYKEDCDRNKAFEYMYILAYMLACKKRWFTNIDDYDGYAYLLAYSTFQRMANPKVVKIKSVLNYMKSIMGWRKTTYQKEIFSEVINPDYYKDWNGDLYTEQNIARIESNNQDQVNIIVKDLISKLPETIFKSIPDHYLNNKLQRKNIYTSVLLSLLCEYTLPCVNKEFLEKKKQESLTFNSSEYYNKHLTNEVILWYLPQNMKSVVILVLNKVKTELLYDIKDIINDYKLSEEEYNNIFRDIIFGESNETDYTNE